MNVSNKTQTAIATLVAAIPASVLGYFVVTSFLGGLEHLPTVYEGLYGATLAGCAAMVFLPFAVLIFGPKASAKKPAADARGKEAAAAKADGSEEAKSDESQTEVGFEESNPEIEAEAIEEATEAPLSTGELEIVEPTPSDADFDAFDGFDESSAETEAHGSSADDEFTFDDEDIEPPKNKKK
jgi:hypothetical protein